MTSTLIIVTSYNFINSLNSVTEKLLAIGFSSSLLTSLLILVKLEQIIEKLYTRRDLTKKQLVITAKEAPLRKFYSTIISRIILAFSFLILSLASLFSPFREIPDGILFDLLKPIELNLFLALLFGIILLFLIYRIMQQFREYKPRLQRASIYYLLLKDKDVYSRKNAHISTIQDYGSALTLNDWSTEESIFNKLKRDYYGIFIEGLVDIKAFIRAVDKPFRNYDNLKYFFDIGSRQSSLMNTNYIKNTLNVSNLLGIKLFSDLNAKIHLKLVNLQTNVEKLHKDLAITAKGMIKVHGKSEVGLNLRNMLLVPEHDHKLYEIYQDIINDTEIIINFVNIFIKEFKQLSNNFNDKEKSIINFFSTVQILNEKIES